MRGKYTLEEDFWGDLDFAVKNRYLVGHHLSNGRPALVEPSDRTGYERAYLEVLALAC